MLLIPAPILIGKRRARDKSAWVRPPSEISQDCRRQIGYIPSRDGRKKTPVTVAAGFRCADGVLLCADSQITFPGYLKFPRAKVISMAGVQWSPSFAYCGDVYQSKDAIARLGVTIARSRKERIAPNVRNLAASICRRQTPPGTRCQLELLVAWQRSRKIELWHLNGSSLSPVTEYQMIGCGMDMMMATAMRFYLPGMGLRDASYMAAYSLYQAKEHVDMCGKKSLIYLAFDDGRRAAVTQEEIEELEASFSEFQKISASALIAKDSGSLTKATAALKGVLRKAFAKRKSRNLLFL